MITDNILVLRGFSFEPLPRITSMMLLFAAFVCLCLCLSLCSSSLFVSAVNNGLALTPQMGWNSWNHYHCSVNADVLREQAAAMISSGLNKHGYEYVNIGHSVKRLINVTHEPWPY